MNDDVPPAEDDCPPDADVPEGTLVRELSIINKRGLHARAAARLVQTVERFEAEVKLTRCGETVGGTSIMAILMLAAPVGSSVRFSARGKEAEAVLDALEKLLAEKFGEDE
jgi:phosphocarrier protein